MSVVKLKEPMVVYKSVFANGSEPAVAVLLLPKGTRVNSPYLENTEKKRADKARVLSIESADGLTRYKTAVAPKRKEFKYRVGAIVRPKEKFDASPTDCGSGIHFYLRRRETLTWVGLKGQDPQVPELQQAKQDAAEARVDLIGANNKVIALQMKIHQAKKLLG